MFRNNEQALDPPIIAAAKIAPFRYYGDTRNYLAHVLGHPVSGNWVVAECSRHPAPNRCVIRVQAFRFLGLANCEPDNRIDVGWRSVADNVVRRQEWN